MAAFLPVSLPKGRQAGLSVNFPLRRARMGVKVSGNHLMAAFLHSASRSFLFVSMRRKKSRYTPKARWALNAQRAEKLGFSYLYWGSQLP